MSAAEATQRVEPEIRAVARTETGVAIDLVVPVDLVYFAGHFPGAPILPGVVQIAWAHRLAVRHLGAAEDLGSAARVKFKRAIGPGEALTLTLTPRADGAGFAFEYAGANGTRSVGSVGRSS